MLSTARGLAGAILCFAFCIAAAASAQAADIKLLTTGAMREVAAEAAQQFEKETGHKVTVDNATAGGLAKRIGDGEAFDVAIITPVVLDDLAAKGKIVVGSRVDLAKVGMGVAVKEGARLPDIGSVEAFKQTLLDARAVAYTDPAGGGTSGTYFDKLLDKLGIAGPVRAKAKLKRGGYAAELVANGEADVAVHQISEILPVKGVTLVGPLPAEVQNITTYAVGLSPTAGDKAAAKALMAHLAGPATAAALRARGMMKP
jgi:molybdate transport system substrate-binding protein